MHDMPDSPGFRFTVRGARGSTPVGGPAFVRFGEATTCFSLETDAGVLVIDAGTGALALGRELAARNPMPEITLLFTHFHLDHLIGLPPFAPLCRADTRVRLMADAQRPEAWRETVRGFMQPPLWPVPLERAGARVDFTDLPMTRGHVDIYGVRVSWCPVRHPQGCLAYRLEFPGMQIVVATDREPGQPEMDAAFRAFCRGADVLICDAQYLPEEYPTRRGWGHGTWQEAVTQAQAAGVRALILTHHDQTREDAEVDRIVNLARERFPATQAAFGGMVVCG